MAGETDTRANCFACQILITQARLLDASLKMWPSITMVHHRLQRGATPWRALQPLASATHANPLYGRCVLMKQFNPVTSKSIAARR